MAAKSMLTSVTRGSCLNFFKNKTVYAATGLANQNVFLAPPKAVSSYNFVKLYSSNESKIPIVSYEDIKQLTKQPKKLLIDVREPQELQETGQIPTSINIPLGQVTEELGPGVDNSVFRAKYGRDKPEKNTEIIFHCKIGRRSLSAAEKAKTLGYQNIYNYLGSWTEWAEKEGLPK